MRKTGFTLVELLIAMGISVIVGGMLMIIIVNSAGLFQLESSKLTQGLNATDALVSVRNQIKQSSAIDAQSTAEKLVTKIPSIDIANNIIPNTFDNIVFLKDANKLRLKITPNPASARIAQDQIFSTDVDSLKFEYFNSENPPVEVAPASATKIRINLTLKQLVGTKIETTIVSSEASLRND